MPKVVGMAQSPPPAPRQGAASLVALAQFALAACLGFAWRGVPGAALGGGVGAALAWLSWRQQRVAVRRALAAEEAAVSAQANAAASRLAQEGRGNELALLGRYGNLLIACTDLAEVLQVSQQMLSLLLPESAGTIYPLIDGEGLAEATHLWGIHAADTRMQASAEDCWCMQRRRVHPSGSASADGLCAHVLAPACSASFTSACIPLVAQGESLGWLYLSAAGDSPLPKLAVAVAAADQLALALANLKLRQSLRDLSVRDPLTGLFNRRYLSESLAREIARARRRSKTVAVMAFDLDHFKAFNDDYGHPAGDAVLVAFARILQANSRSEDIACRQGGEEFVLILPEMEMEVAMRRAGDLMKRLAGLDLVHDGQLLPPLSTSIGLAIYPDHGATPEALLAQADAALYAAKANGRNRFSVAPPPNNSPAP
jgi:diguanylate cyclase (GGDEF)-like protein